MNILNDHISKALQKQEGHSRYPVMEHFYSLQGEGYNTGQASFFIRLGGCDVGCHWCDVKESWDASLHPILSVGELIEIAKSHKGRNIVVTGGEPCMYDLNPLTDSFRNSGFKLWIETSGAYEISGSFDWICVSPKKTKPPIESALKIASELKVIIYNHDDFKWARTFLQGVNDQCLLYLQPEWSRKEKMLPEIIEFIKSNPEWRLSLQTHKYLDIR